MNIFVLDTSPKLAAEYHCDKHVVKMILESAQLLCSALHLNGVEAPYRLTHKNHPCAIWTRESRENYEWLLDLTYRLCEEYTHRYGKVHKTLSSGVVAFCNEQRKVVGAGEFTPFALAMPDEYRGECPVKAYRAYYIGEKQHIAKWSNREKPQWYKQH